MPRPKPRGREKRELTMDDCSLIDKLALAAGKPHHRGWEVHTAFASQAEFDQFCSDHAEEIEPLQTERAAQIAENEARHAAYLAERRRQGLDAFVSKLFPPGKENNMALQRETPFVWTPFS